MRTRDRLGDDRAFLVTAAYAVAMLLLGLAPDLRLQWSAAPVTSWTATALAAVPLTAAHLARHLRPGRTLTLMLVVAVTEAAVTRSTSAGTLLFCADALYLFITCSRAPQTSRQVGIASVASLSAIMLGLVVSPSMGAPFDQLLSLGMIVTVTLWWASTVQAPRREAENERLRAMAIQNVAESREAATVLRERIQFSRELHDAVSGHLAAISIHAHLALDGDPDQTTSSLRRIQHSAEAALKDTHSLIDMLRNVEGSPQRHDLSEYPAFIQFIRDQGTDIEVDADPVPDEIDPLASAAAYRVIHEGVSNAIKHAPDQPLRVEIRCGDLLEIHITNPLSGTRSSLSGGFGLLGLDERVRLAGGRLVSEARDGQWVLEARIPQDETVELR
ncbi:hypothetical protein GCM10027418_00340 [Mariniluteicoccus endophyticus]